MLISESKLEFGADQAPVCMMFVKLFTSESISSDDFNLTLSFTYLFIISQNLIWPVK